MRTLVSIVMAGLVLAFYALVGVERLPNTGAFSPPGPGFGAGALHGYFSPFNLLASFFGESGVYEDFPRPGYLGGFLLGTAILLIGNLTLFLASIHARKDDGESGR